MNTPGSRLAVLPRPLDGRFATSRGRAITCGAFLAEAMAWAERLPDKPYAINLCGDRYLFMTAFIAALLRGQCTLLPPCRQADALRALLRSFPDAYLLHDGVDAPPEAHEFQMASDLAATSPVETAPEVSAERLAAIVFTSGSTGDSQAVRKTWRTLMDGARVNLRYAGPDAGPEGGLLATVPPGHMYGLEWSVMLPLVANRTLCCDGAFFPDDIRLALENLPRPRTLVSTPLHLRALVKSGLRFPAVDTVLSATAPLDLDLAREVERQLAARVLEIYGCSEAGSMACRWPVRDAAWRFFREFNVDASGDRVRVSAAHLPDTIELVDRLEFHADGRFALRGRDGDLVKIAGRRASLCELNNRLLALDGVDDAIVFHPPAFGLEDSGRLAALVVSSSRSADSIRRELARVVERAFLPRPIRLVGSLPRSAAGKLRREDLLKLLGAERETA